MNAPREKARTEDAAYDTNLFVEHFTDKKSLGYGDVSFMDCAREFLGTTYGQRYARLFERRTKTHYRQAARRRPGLV